MNLENYIKEMYGCLNPIEDCILLDYGICDYFIDRKTFCIVLMYEACLNAWDMGY